jgi:hypothetical protein
VGLDLVVEGCAKPGHETEWRHILERSFAEEELSKTEIARFEEISIPAYQCVDAPRVGFDRAADAWIIEARKVKAEDVDATLREFHGYYVLRLVKCDGIPSYSNAGLYGGVDETSFRGAFLRDCTDVLDNRLLNDAWNHKLPEAAISYGQALLAAANAAEGRTATRRRSFLSLLRLAKPSEPAPFAEQLDIVRAAGRWFIFWGERGHAIRAYF